jgi:hypothetical protein
MELGVFYGHLKVLRQRAAAAQAACDKAFTGLFAGNYLVRKGAFLYHLANFLRGPIFI